MRAGSVEINAHTLSAAWALCNIAGAAAPNEFGELAAVQPAVARDPRHQIFHLILQDSSVLQHQVLVPVGHVGRVEQRHACGFRRASAFDGIAAAARGNDIHPTVAPTLMQRDDMIAG